MSLLPLLLGAAWAGQWLPQPSPDAVQELVLEQPGEERVLLRVEPADTPVVARSEGLQLVLQAGPQGTWLVPPGDRSRQVELRFETPVELDHWLETSNGEAASWNRYERELGRWIRGDGTLPPAPAAIPALELEWQARHDSLRATRELDPELEWALALWELQTLRARGGSDHPERALPAEVLQVDEGLSRELEGPGVVRVRSRVVMQDQDFQVFQVEVRLDGELVDAPERRAGEDPELPGLGWPRTTLVQLPAGLHTVQVDALTHPVSVELVHETLRPAFRARGTAARLVDAQPLSGVLAMERAHVLGDSALAAELARELLDGPAGELARARLVEHTEDSSEVVATWGASDQGPLVSTALARRIMARDDIGAVAILPVADNLPADPELLAGLAGALTQDLVRPRSVALRRAAGLRTLGRIESRWTELTPEGEFELVALRDQSVGVRRVVVPEGATVELDLPPDPHGYPVLRLESEQRVAYELDGERREGSGRLFEALVPGEHRVTVREGALAVMDPEWIVGGRGWVIHEREVASTPASWALPEPGYPGRIQVAVVGGPGQLSLGTDDGRSWLVDVPAPPAPDQASVVVRLDIGPEATRLDASSPQALQLSVAAERSLEDSTATWLPLEGDPVEMLLESSRDLVAAVRDDADVDTIARHRLRRATALGALGYHGSARNEAMHVPLMEGVSPELRAIALAPSPWTMRADEPGPTTLDAVLARHGHSLPEEPHPRDMERLAASLPDADAAPLWREAAAWWLAQGDPVRAWLAADRAGAEGLATRNRAEWAGAWQSLPHVDRDGGVVTQTSLRTPPTVEEDGLRAVARERLLDAPWPASDYAVVREGRTDRLRFEGSGELGLSLLCRDETAMSPAGPCPVTVWVDGEPHEVALRESELALRSWPLGPGSHEVVVGAPEQPGHAVLVHARLGGELLEPRVNVAAHRLGGSGVRVVVAAPALFRVKVYRGGPVRVRIGDEEVEVAERAILPVTDEGALTLRITGPSESLVSLARLEPDREPDPLALEMLIDPAQAAALPISRPGGTVVDATDEWLRRLTDTSPTLIRPMESGGTWALFTGAGNDPRIDDDSRIDHQYVMIGGTWRQRPTDAPHWLRARATGRFSPVGAPAAGLDLAWHWLPDPWVVSVDTEGWISGGFGHLSLSGEARYRFDLSTTWRAQPFVEAELGAWSAQPSVRADPRAWSDFGYDHPAWLGAGAHLDWRPYRDAWLRGTVRARTNSDTSLDRLDLGLRAQLLLSDQLNAKTGLAMGYRSQDRDRSKSYWLPSVHGGVDWQLWMSDRRRATLGADLTWFPGPMAFDAAAVFTWEGSPRRGLRDHSPLDQPFQGALDLPLEMLQ